MAKVGIRRFVDALQHSGLAPVEVLREALTRCREQTGKPLSDPDALAEFLIAEGLITAWHSDKLLTGKYKGFLLGNYRLLRHIGSGGMSSVYLAEHRETGVRRAIKVLPRKRVTERSYLQRFRHEAEATRRLNHPNIVKAFELGEDHGTFYYVMEFVEGRDLSEVVKTDGPLDFVLAARLAAQTARALHYAHQEQLIHRDIKPGNLLIDSKGDVKLLDLGLAMSSVEDASITRMHRERVIGTADYLSPEQAVDSHRVDHRSDLYSLGCTLYFMLTGHAPFPSGSLAERIASHQTIEPKDIRASRPNCPTDLIAIVRRMMSKKASERYQDADQVFQALDRWLAGRGATVEGSRYAPIAAGATEPHDDSRSEAREATVVELAGETAESKKKVSSRKSSRTATQIKTVIVPDAERGTEAQTEFEPITPAPLPGSTQRQRTAHQQAADDLDPMAPAIRKPKSEAVASTPPTQSPAVATRWVAASASDVVPLEVVPSKFVVTERGPKSSSLAPWLKDWRFWLITAGVAGLVLAISAAVIFAIWIALN